MQQTKETNLNTSLGQTCSSRMKKHNLSGWREGSRYTKNAHVTSRGHIAQIFSTDWNSGVGFNVTKNSHTQHFKEKCR